MGTNELAKKITDRVTEIRDHNISILQAQADLGVAEDSEATARQGVSKSRAELRERSMYVEEERIRVGLLKFRSFFDEIRGILEGDDGAIVISEGRVEGAEVDPVLAAAAVIRDVVEVQNEEDDDPVTDGSEVAAGMHEAD